MSHASHHQRRQQQHNFSRRSSSTASRGRDGRPHRITTVRDDDYLVDHQHHRDEQQELLQRADGDSSNALRSASPQPPSLYDTSTSSTADSSPRHQHQQHRGGSTTATGAGGKQDSDFGAFIASSSSNKSGRMGGSVSPGRQQHRLGFHQQQQQQQQQSTHGRGTASRGNRSPGPWRNSNAPADGSSSVMMSPNHKHLQQQPNAMYSMDQQQQFHPSTPAGRRVLRRQQQQQKQQQQRDKTEHATQQRHSTGPSEQQDQRTRRQHHGIVVGSGAVVDDGDDSALVADKPPSPDDAHHVEGVYSEPGGGNLGIARRHEYGAQMGGGGITDDVCNTHPLLRRWAARVTHEQQFRSSNDGLNNTGETLEEKKEDHGGSRSAQNTPSTSASRLRVATAEGHHEIDDEDAQVHRQSYSYQQRRKPVASSAVSSSRYNDRGHLEGAGGGVGAAGGSSSVGNVSNGSSSGSNTTGDGRSRSMSRTRYLAQRFEQSTLTSPRLIHQHRQNRSPAANRSLRSNQSDKLKDDDWRQGYRSNHEPKTSRPRSFTPVRRRRPLQPPQSDSERRPNHQAHDTVLSLEHVAQDGEAAPSADEGYNSADTSYSGRCEIETPLPARVCDLKEKLWDDSDRLQVSVRASLRDDSPRRHKPRPQQCHDHVLGAVSSRSVASSKGTSRTEPREGRRMRGRTRIRTGLVDGDMGETAAQTLFVDAKSPRNIRSVSPQALSTMVPNPEQEKHHEQEQRQHQQQHQQHQLHQNDNSSTSTGSSGKKQKIAAKGLLFNSKFYAAAQRGMTVSQSPDQSPMVEHNGDDESYAQESRPRTTVQEGDSSMRSEDRRSSEGIRETTTVASLVAKLNAVKKDNPSAALAQIEAILLAESSSSAEPALVREGINRRDCPPATGAGSEAVSSPALPCQKHENVSVDEPVQQPQPAAQCDDAASQSSEDSTVSSITNPTYQSFRHTGIETVDGSSMRVKTDSLRSAYARENTSDSNGQLPTPKTSHVSAANLADNSKSGTPTNQHRLSPGSSGDGTGRKSGHDGLHRLEEVSIEETGSQHNRSVETSPRRTRAEGAPWSKWLASGSQPGRQPDLKDDARPASATNQADLAEKIRRWDEMSHHDIVMSTNGSEVHPNEKVESSKQQLPDDHTVTSPATEELGSILTPLEDGKLLGQGEKDASKDESAYGTGEKTSEVLSPLTPMRRMRLERTDQQAKTASKVLNEHDTKVNQHRQSGMPGSATSFVQEEVKNSGNETSGGIKSLTSIAVADLDSTWVDMPSSSYFSENRSPSGHSKSSARGGGLEATSRRSKQMTPSKSAGNKAASHLHTGRRTPDQSHSSRKSLHGHTGRDSMEVFSPKSETGVHTARRYAAFSSPGRSGSAAVADKDRSGGVESEAEEDDIGVASADAAKRRGLRGFLKRKGTGAVGTRDLDQASQSTGSKRSSWNQPQRRTALTRMDLRSAEGEMSRQNICDEENERGRVQNQSISPCRERARSLDERRTRNPNISKKFHRLLKTYDDKSGGRKTYDDKSGGRSYI